MRRCISVSFCFTVSLLLYCLSVSFCSIACLSPSALLSLCFCSTVCLLLLYCLSGSFCSLVFLSPSTLLFVCLLLYCLPVSCSIVYLDPSASSSVSCSIVCLSMSALLFVCLRVLYCLSPALLSASCSIVCPSPSALLPAWVRLFVGLLACMHVCLFPFDLLSVWVRLFVCLPLCLPLCLPVHQPITCMHVQLHLFCVSLSLRAFLSWPQCFAYCSLLQHALRDGGVHFDDCDQRWVFCLCRKKTRAARDRKARAMCKSFPKYTAKRSGFSYYFPGLQ